jgi:4-hydroxy-tetrahydrodipicolinate reductase
MIYKVGILGVSGRMGQEIAALLSQDFSVKGDTLEFSDAVSGSKKLSSIEGVPVRKMQDPVFDPAHVWIDFSTPAATLAYLEVATTPLVIGTTGFTPDQKKRIEEYSNKQPVLMSSNMSPGMNYMLKMLKMVPVTAASGFNDTVLEEIHHKHKKDSPSGTSKDLLAVLTANGITDVQLHVTRAGENKGEHTVRFISQDEELVIQHKVSDRSVFAKGALLAAHFIIKRKPGLYSMQDLEVS